MSALHCERELFAVVVHGLLGQGCGDTPAGLALDVMVARLAARRSRWRGHPREELFATFAEADRSLRAAEGTRGTSGPMGATAVALLSWEDRAHLLHIGHCRAYLARAGAVTAATRDQTVANLPDAAATDLPAWAATTPIRALGLGDRPAEQAEYGEFAMGVGDSILLCSPGLASHADRLDLAAWMLDRTLGAEQACRSIVTAAIDVSGTDRGHAALLARFG